MEYEIITFNLTDSHHYGDALEKTLRLRYQLISEGDYDGVYMGYGGLDFDQYDTPLAKYIAIRKNGDVVACARLHRTDYHHKVGDSDISYMINDLCCWKDQLPEKYLFTDAETYELTRLCVCSSFKNRERGKLSRILAGALYLYCISINARRCVFVTELNMVNLAKRVGVGANILHEQNIAVDGFQNQKFMCVDIPPSIATNVVDLINKSVGFDLAPFMQNCKLSQSL